MSHPAAPASRVRSDHAWDEIVHTGYGLMIALGMRVVGVAVLRLGWGRGP